MRFLCVSCNSQMKLVDRDKAVKPDSAGSLSIQYECPECLMEIAMLTNAFETQMVSSLGVEIGGKTVDGEEKTASAGASKCPFSSMAKGAIVEEGKQSDGGVRWTAQANVRLLKIPEFVRPMAKKGIEEFALKQGYKEVNEECLDLAKDHFNM